MPSTFNQRGFNPVILIAVVLAAIIIVGLISWRVYDTFNTNNGAAYENSNITNEEENRIPKESEEQLTSKFKIEDLGIEIELPPTLKGSLTLHNTKQGNNTFAAFSTEDITNQYPQCSADSGDAPLGVLVKSEGQYPHDANATNASGKLVKQFEGYYIAYRDPSQPCSDHQAAQTVIQDALMQFKESFKTITPAT